MRLAEGGDYYSVFLELFKILSIHLSDASVMSLGASTLELNCHAVHLNRGHGVLLLSFATVAAFCMAQ